MTGVNGGEWFASVLGRDNISLGSQRRLTPNYIKASLNKIAYSSISTPTNESDILSYFSNQLNHR